MQRRGWLFLVFGGAAILTAGLVYLDADLDPPAGSMRVVLWPADFLLWATGPGVQLTNGRYEWTQVQDLAMWVGYGVSWAFWLTVVWLLSSRVLHDRADRAATNSRSGPR